MSLSPSVSPSVSPSISPFVSPSVSPPLNRNIPKGIKIICTNDHRALGNSISAYLGINLVNMTEKKFANGECNISIHESLRGFDVYILGCGYGNVNDNFMKILCIIDACTRASAWKITAVIPNFPYARQDKKDKSRVPISAKLIASLLERAGVNHVITMELHAAQIQGFFTIPVDNLYFEPAVVKHIKDKIPNYLEAVLVSPDAGGAKRVTSLADVLGVDFALIHKERKIANKVSRMILIGDVVGKIAILIDDMADTCGTLCTAVKKLLEAGAIKVYAYMTHGIFSRDAISKINSSKITKIIVSNSLSQQSNIELCERLEVIDISPILGTAINCAHIGKSVSALFK